MPKIGEQLRPIFIEAKPTYYLGIDPGSSGGLAVIRVSDEVRVIATQMLKTPRDIWLWLSQGKNGDAIRPNTFAALEKVGGYIKGNPAPGSAMFQFGKGAGWLEMALIAADISYEEVTPQRWQKALGIPSRKKDEKPTAWKNRLKKRAQELFPKLAAGSITLATADALLIAEFCRRSREGTLNA